MSFQLIDHETGKPKPKKAQSLPNRRMPRVPPPPSIYIEPIPPDSPHLKKAGSKSWGRKQEEILPFSLTIELSDGSSVDLEEVDTDGKIVQRRNAQAVELRDDMAALHETFVLMGQEVQEQSESLDNVEQSVHATDETVQESIYVLQQAQRLKSTNMRLKLTLLGGSVGGIIGGVGGAAGASIVATPAAGVVAGVGGMAAGAAAGSAFANIIGAVIDSRAQNNIDNTLVTHYKQNEGPKWIADNERNDCTHCNKSFHSFLRRHHCRVCGGLFCWECSKWRLPIRYPGVDAPRLERICIECKDQLAAAQTGATDRFHGQRIVVSAEPSSPPTTITTTSTTST